MISVLSVLLLVAAGFPLTLALTRAPGLSVLLAPLITALTSTVAVVGMLVCGGQLLGWLIAAFAAHAPLVWLAARRHAPAWPLGSWTEALWLGLPLIAPFLKVFGPPVYWDSHAIWWLHAAYFAQGADRARTVMSDPLAAFSHTDYPPLASATIAGAWTVLDPDSFMVAQVVTSAITLSAIAMLGHAIRRVTASAPVWLSRALAIAVSLTAWATAPDGVASGYCDSLWACALVAAAVLLLMPASGQMAPLLASLLIGVAALTKNEGLVTAGLLALLVTVRERRTPRRLWAVWPPVFLGAGWMFLTRVIGATSDVANGDNLRNMVTGDPEVLRRAVPIVVELGKMVGPPVACAALAALLAGVWLRGRRAGLGLGSDGWLWTLCLGYTASLSLTYLISSNDIDWYLAGSLDRVSLPIVLLASASAAGWLAVAVRGGDGPTDGGPDGSEPSTRTVGQAT